MSSRGIPLTAINGGMNRLRVKGAARKDTLYQLTNAYVTAGNTIKPRGGTIRNADLSLLATAGSTKGLVAHQGALHVFSSQKVAVPAGYVDHVLTHPATTYISGVTPNPVPATSIASMLHFNDGSGSTAFVDSANGARVWSAHGAAIESTAQQKFGTGSGSFPNNLTTCYISTPISAGDALDTTQGSFTLECWVYLNAYTAGFASELFNAFDGGGNNSGPRWYILANGAVEVNCGAAGFLTSAAAAVSVLAWHHVALVWDGNLLSTYVDGVRVAVKEVDPNNWPAVSANHLIYVGGGPVYGGINGYMDDFRVTQGYALYTGTTYAIPTAEMTIPPATPAYQISTLLHFEDGASTFVDSSLSANVWTAGGTNGTCIESNARAKFGTASLFSSGTNAYIRTPQNVGSPLDLTGGADYTVRYWVYPTTLSAPNTDVVHVDLSGGGTTLFRISMRATGVIGVQFYGASTFSNTLHLGAIPLNVNAWNHVAFVRSGNLHRLFINGVLDITVIATAGAPIVWGALPGSGNYAYLAAAYNSGSTNTGLSNGNLDEVEIDYGLAIYDRTFAPPSVPGTDASIAIIPLKEIHFAAPFMGFLYVAAEFTTDGGSGLGTVFHYWLQTSGKWIANTIYQVGQIISPNVDNGLTYRAERFGAPNPAWAPSTLKAVNDKVEPTVPNGFLYTATAVDGGNPITGTTEPTWPLVSGGVVFEESEKLGTGEVATPAPQPGLTTPSPGTGGRYINPYSGSVTVLK